MDDTSAPGPALSPGTRLGPYEIVAKLGAGGMGEVYRARDARLGRDVAIKVLLAAVAGNRDRLARFELEARAAGQLQHPNIVAVYDVGTHGRAPYLVTELLEGETLRDRLRGGAPPVAMALDFARQLARGLAAAHAKGIVHRDVKPENVFVTRDGQVKILDFGLAKLVESDEVDTVATKTTAGLIVGTIGYMAPEQVRGQRADPRADIFAFGAILYEMLTGERAFHGDSPADTMSAILHNDPPELGSRVTHLAAGLDPIVRRCLQKDPAGRFHSASDVAFALETLSNASAAPATIGVAVGQRAGRRVRAGRLIAAGAVVVVALLIAGWQLVSSRWNAPPEQATAETGARVVAVLAFKNISADPAQAYFSAGMTEEIRGQLSKVSALRVLSRSAVDRYGDADVRRIAQELAAGSVVEGSVRLDKERVRISVQLVDTRSEQTLWSEQYDRGLQDIFAVQSDVAQRIAEALNARLSPAERQRIEKRPTENAAAYQLYLRAQEVSMSIREQNLNAIAMLRKAVEMDPNFAEALARTAYRTSFLGTYGDAKHFDEAIALAQQALRIDPTLSTAHMTIATSYSQQGRLSDARLSFLRAMEFDPNHAASMNNLSIAEIELGRFDEALMWARRAFLLAPNRATGHYHVGETLLHLVDDEALNKWLTQARHRFPGDSRIEILQAMLDYFAGRQREAVTRGRSLVTTAPRNEEALQLLGELLFLTEDPEAMQAATAQFEKAADLTAGWWLMPHSPRVQYAFLLTSADPGRSAQLMNEALSLAQNALKSGHQSPRVPMEIAAVHAARKEREAALEWLQRAYQAGYREYRILARDPVFRALRDDRRFVELLERMEKDVAEMRRRANISETLPVPPPLIQTPTQ